jgi:hypothetical protein
LTLKLAFPVLFSIAYEKEASVAANVLGGASQWRVRFNREAHDWEVDDFASLFSVLHSIRLEEGAKISCGGFPPNKVPSR